jgi:hypothetical protein
MIGPRTRRLIPFISIAMGGVVSTMAVTLGVEFAAVPLLLLPWLLMAVVSGYYSESAIGIAIVSITVAGISAWQLLDFRSAAPNSIYAILVLVAFQFGIGLLTWIWVAIIRAFAP